MFENFYAQEWVQVSTAFVFIIAILITPLMYWRISRKLKGDMKKKFVEAALDIYGVVLFLLIAPAGYLILYFFGSQSKFMLNDPMAWVCFVGGAASVYDLIRASMALKSASESARCNERTGHIFMYERLTKLAICLSLIPLLYGIVMIGVTNLMDPASINNMLWFLTFMITGLAVIYAVASKTLLLVSQDYASNPELGC
ncbi:MULTISPECIES: hypothetical protein [unclassified Pseudomonas]|uniref:hypothetical protein n=1 Tax=unclassified Pseudomonas TaxID=196821 RepID=UPI0021C7AEBF|nr:MULTISPECIES: hypothetical protein [unclassified Pseudomonas]MCU1735100.1 hypothetical protein [Pseudomonas sp. 20P_3.2_Bac4]MCU1743575.1 hypothetical protein [Pseudomonas sp. 20P_3.2_Bac5]